MASYLIDTDICISFLKKKYNLARKIDSVGLENCFISEITLAELTFGAYNSSRIDHHLKEVALIGEIFELKPILPVIDLYGQERARLRKTGTTGLATKFHYK
ncbi:MAG: hypothetical protein AAF741_12060 [Bacteroidota bacterium]